MNFNHPYNVLLLFTSLVIMLMAIGKMIGKMNSNRILIFSAAGCYCIFILTMNFQFLLHLHLLQQHV